MAETNINRTTRNMHDETVDEHLANVKAVNDNVKRIQGYVKTDVFKQIKFIFALTQLAKGGNLHKHYMAKMRTTLVIPSGWTKAN